MHTFRKWWDLVIFQLFIYSCSCSINPAWFWKCTPFDFQQIFFFFLQSDTPHFCVPVVIHCRVFYLSYAGVSQMMRTCDFRLFMYNCSSSINLASFWNYILWYPALFLVFLSNEDPTMICLFFSLLSICNLYLVQVAAQH